MLSIRSLHSTSVSSSPRLTPLLSRLAIDSASPNEQFSNEQSSFNSSPIGIINMHSMESNLILNLNEQNSLEQKEIDEEKEEQSTEETKKDLIVVAQKKKAIVKRRQSSRRQIVKKEFSYEMILNFAQKMNDRDGNQPLHIFRNLSTIKAFFIAGDIIVEIEQSQTEDHHCKAIMNEFRNIVKVERLNDFISIEVESISPLKELNHVIYCLENSQDQSNYQFAQLVRSHQPIVSQISEIIDEFLKQYEGLEDELATLIAERKRYARYLRVIEIAKLMQNDEFSCIATQSISFVNKSTTIGSVGLTKAMIAIVGQDDIDFPQSILRQGFLNLFSFKTRRTLFSAVLSHQLTDKPIIIEMEGMQIRTVDNILIRCNSVVQAIPIVFPKHLQFKGKGAHLLNQLELLLVIKYQITKQHIESILHIRNEQFIREQERIQALKSKQKSNELINQRDERNDFKDQMEVLNLQYSLQTYPFLLKFYKQKFQAIEGMQQEKEEEVQKISSEEEEQENLQIEEQKKQCGYRFVNQPINYDPN